MKQVPTNDEDDCKCGCWDRKDGVWAGMCFHCGHDYFKDEAKPLSECTHYHSQPEPWEGLECICAAIDAHLLICKNRQSK